MPSTTVKIAAILGAFALTLLYLASSGPRNARSIATSGLNKESDLSEAEPKLTIPAARSEAPPITGARTAYVSVADNSIVDKEWIAGSGAISGRIFDAQGDAIPDAVIVFRPKSEPMVDRGATVFADEFGAYRKRLRPGNWRIYFGGRRNAKTSGWILMGEAEVQSAQDLAFDLYVTGSRALSGGIWATELDEILIELELRLAFDTSVLIAKANCFTSSADYEEYADAMGEIDPDVAISPTVWPPGRGAFHFEDLPADVYELRAYFDVSKEYYVWGLVDLVDGDLEFAPIGLPSEGFLRGRELDL